MPRLASTCRWMRFIAAMVVAAVCGSVQKTRCAKWTVSKKRSTGAWGKAFVKKSQSTALRAANSAAPPAKKSRTASGLLQIRRATGGQIAGGSDSAMCIDSDLDHGQAWDGGTCAWRV